ncbi:hypothetical protein DSM104299_04935 [Baekduia alba]|uniref:GntR family transcriptional regulator n=1 Tax=Baekduia alba TaxID=2997333 RepID=UPI0023413CFD|nr:winged helix-turn-helix domain-containing protein [Baekduia alba]WCB96179.1 hypothetical protein DSM104299_04935 [Baekduia alba]
MPGTWAAAVGIALHHEGDVPLGVQLDWSVRAAIAAGRMRPGERLPALRVVATELGVSHNTVRAVVARLEADGILTSRHGAGTFVADAGGDARLANLVDDVVRRADEAGVAPRALAGALWVTDAAEPDAGGGGAAAEAAERRALREELAVLDRVLMDLERRLPEPPRPDTPSRGRGPLLLGVAELRAARDALVGRIATAQRMLDEGSPPASVDQDPAPAPAAQPTRRRRAPRPGPAAA